LKIFFYISLLFFISSSFAFSQNKTNNPSTFGDVCFYTIKKDEFENFLKIKEAVEKEDYSLIYPEIRRMKARLKKFKVAEHDRSFELWYVGNYSDFNEQAIVCRESTLSAIKHYELRLRTDKALYYEHRLFLEQYLAFETEAFFSEYWFMSQERYFSQEAVKRVVSMNNREGKKIFSNSEFYRPFNVFNKLAANEELEIEDYLGVDKKIADTTSFIPYSYMILDKSVAAYILQVFKFDDATMQVDVDREITAFKRFLKQTKEGSIYLIARFNLIELRKLKDFETKKIKN
jgi:hypothetical protein